ncbi:hypothetical protein [Mesorhizobium shangrilense]|uniref:hypothetical protein n=1 Tax=Mesorhizobium shangrilense TaxID=460060 RepID=UPI003F493D5F
MFAVTNEQVVMADGLVHAFQLGAKCAVSVTFASAGSGTIVHPDAFNAPPKDAE